MAPPQLTGDAPVPAVLQPVVPVPVVRGGDQLHCPRLDCLVSVGVGVCECVCE